MEFLKNNRRLSFLYGGKTIDEADFKITQEVKENKVTTIYEHKDGFRLTNIARKIDKFGAYEWVNRLENTSDKPTELITELCDCDCELPMANSCPRIWDSYYRTTGDSTKVYAPTGSRWRFDDFYCDIDEITTCQKENHLYVGVEKEYTTDTGRSSDTRAPFFNIHKDGTGIIAAIGWTGKWRCILNRSEDSVRIRTKVDDTSFKLYGGESVRTSSVVIMPYNDDFINSQNMWRRLVKEEFSLIGSPGRDKYAPLCALTWGGMKSSELIKRVKNIKQNKLPFEYIWIDAGWYGEDTEPTPDAFDNTWESHTGDWVVSKKIHPRELTDVSKAIHDAGMKFLLWFEPERVVKTTPIVKEHPEYFLGSDDNDNLLLNLGNPEAWEYCFNTISSLMEKMNVDGYRQDFNFDPLSFWRKNDWCDRKGITEIKYINGLYKFWDALLEKFPHLIIDNCASGGRRLDIETLKRSVALWRSDAQCYANPPEYITQSHLLNYNTWMPYSGTGSGRLYDIYRVRGAYGTSLASTVYERGNADSDEKIEFIRNFTNEYLRLRPYFSEDFYPLTEMSDKSDVWCAAQFDRPSEKDGIIEVFRRENSPYPKAVFKLYNISENDIYTITDIDTDQSFEISGKELSENGFEVETEQRSAKIFIYSRK